MALGAPVVSVASTLATGDVVLAHEVGFTRFMVRSRACAHSTGASLTRLKVVMA
jgi:hypothetical protein